MNYKLPKKLFTSSIAIVARYSRVNSCGGLVYWDYGRRILSSRNEATGGCLSVSIEWEDFCLNFLPPANSMLQYRNKALEELEGLPYEPFGIVLRRLFPDGGNGHRYGISDKASTKEAMASVKDLTKGRASVKGLYPMRGIRFKYVDRFPDRVELRTENRDALLVIPYRRIRNPKGAKTEGKNLLYYIEQV